MCAATSSPPREGFFIWSPMRKLIAAGCVLAVASAYGADQWKSTRTSTADWVCVDADNTVITSHQRQDAAFQSCSNLTIVDGKARYVQGGRYRVEKVGTPVPTPTPTPTPTQPQPQPQPQRHHQQTLRLA
jgi:hypothetical protein